MLTWYSRLAQEFVAPRHNIASFYGGLLDDTSDCVYAMPPALCILHTMSFFRSIDMLSLKEVYMDETLEGDPTGLPLLALHAPKHLDSGNQKCFPSAPTHYYAEITITSSKHRNSDPGQYGI